MPDATAKSPYTISLTRDRLQVKKMTSWVLGSYWGGWQTPEQVQRAIHNSTVFGCYEIATEEQVGFARVLSDGASNSMVTDVYVDAAHRGRGVGRRLMDAVVAHASVRRTICILASRPENEAFYQKFGFVPIGGCVMKRDPR